MLNMQKLYKTRFQEADRKEKDSVWGGGHLFIYGELFDARGKNNR